MDTHTRARRLGKDFVLIAAPAADNEGGAQRAINEERPRQVSALRLCSFMRDSEQLRVMMLQCLGRIQTHRGTVSCSNCSFRSERAK
jgi:hypothetical protein